MNFFSLTLQSAVSIWRAIKRSLCQLTKPDNHSLALNAAIDMTRSKSELVLENTLLHQQLSVLQRQVQRPKLSWPHQGIGQRIPARFDQNYYYPQSGGVVSTSVLGGLHHSYARATNLN